MLLLGHDGFVCWGVHVWVVGVAEIPKVNQSMVTYNHTANTTSTMYPSRLEAVAWHLLCAICCVAVCCVAVCCVDTHIKARGICYPHNLCQSACACTHTADTTDYFG